MLSNQTQIKFRTSKESIMGFWYNQIGSTLCIQKVIRGKAIKGYYISPLGTGGEIFPLSGIIDRNLDENGLRISFSVNWGKYESMTSWIGYFEEKNGKLQLKTHWQLVKTKPNRSGSSTGGRPGR